MNLKNKIDFKNELNEILAKDNATQEETIEAFEAYMTAIADEMAEKVQAEYRELSNVADATVLAQRGIHSLTPQETAYYNEVKKTGKLPADKLLPETVIYRVFDDIQKERPLLKLIKFRPSIGKEKIITSKSHGVAVWGPLHRDVQGQLDASFDVTETGLHSLTAFFLISNDTLDLGPEWIDRYVRLCLGEAIVGALEKAVILGTGKNEPIGLLKDLKKPVTEGVYTDKESAGTLSFSHDTIVKDITGILSKLSTYDHEYTDVNGEKKTEERHRVVTGKINLIVNPNDYYNIVAPSTIQNANGAFVTNLPFISMDRIVESEFVPAGKVIVYLDNGYEAHIGFANRINVYDQTFAMQRATLYTADIFADGKPSDNSVSLVYDLKTGVTSV